jgi:hypothetical protein
MNENDLPEDENSIIFPNPVKDKFQIDGKNFSVEEMTLYDVSGKEIKSFRSSDADISEVPAGIYFLKVKTDSGELSKKIIKE